MLAPPPPGVGAPSYGESCIRPWLNTDRLKFLKNNAIRGNSQECIIFAKFQLLYPTKKNKILLQMSRNILLLWKKYDINTQMMDQETFDIKEVCRGPEVGNYYNFCPCTAFCGLSSPDWM